MKRKVLLAIADGVGDLPIKELDEKTPLQYASTPTLDLLAKEGSSGIMDLLDAGIPVGTDLGHMLLFGYPNSAYPGRGPIEAAGIGLDIQSGDIAFRCNFATVDGNGVVLDRRAGRINQKTSELASALNGVEVDGIKVIFKEATEHRAVMILRGLDLSEKITDTDPKLPEPGLNFLLSKSIDGLKESVNTARVLNELLEKFHHILKAHPVNKEREENGLLPANFILTRGAGKVPNIQKMTEQFGFKGACVASESTVLGAAKIAGFKLICKEGMTGNLDTDIYLKAQLALEALKMNDFVVLHFKAPDLMGHDNNPLGKVKAIEKYDKMLSYVLENRQENTLIALAADHSTPCSRKEHSGDPVPIVLNGKNIRVDNVDKYNEIDCANGIINRINATMFSNLLYDYLHLTKKQGN